MEVQQGLLLGAVVADHKQHFVADPGAAHSVQPMKRAVLRGDGERDGRRGQGAGQAPQRAKDEPISAVITDAAFSRHRRHLQHPNTFCRAHAVFEMRVVTGHALTSDGDHSSVVAEGFAYDNRVWPSLSAIARAITGTRWNGWLFFGLKSRAGA